LRIAGNRLAAFRCAGYADVRAPAGAGGLLVPVANRGRRPGFRPGGRPRFVRLAGSRACCPARQGTGVSGPGVAHDSSSFRVRRAVSGKALTASVPECVAHDIPPFAGGALVRRAASPPSGALPGHRYYAPFSPFLSRDPAQSRGNSHLGDMCGLYAVVIYN
jgi:hypothetical protein